MKKVGFAITLFLVLGLVLAACAPKAALAPSPAPSQAPTASPAPALSEWDKVLAAAKKEGTVTVYNVFGAITGKAMEEGMKKYGIKVENIGGIGNDLELKIKTEQQAKTYFADVFMGGWVNQRNVVAQGFGQPVEVAIPSLQEKDVWFFHPGKYDPTKSAYIISTSLDAPVTINTTLVKQGEITKWDDLLNPQWKGKIVLQDPRVGSGPGTSGMAAALDLGEEFWKK
ncbi:MAG: extracellular solute-binding protein family 1, partial [Dehalococcoidia bacterium]|nr:extracellular solute-binding protein family 1 [Dehalococcoidia bacterium]